MIGAIHGDNDPVVKAELSDSLTFKAAETGAGRQGKVERSNFLEVLAAISALGAGAIRSCHSQIPPSREGCQRAG